MKFFISGVPKTNKIVSAILDSSYIEITE